MIDRLVHHAKVLTLTGDSYRTRQRRQLLAKENRAAADQFHNSPMPNLGARCRRSCREKRFSLEL
jgi:hypothetical protein